MEPLRIFEKFKLDEINKNWVENMWSHEFMFIDKIPGDYLLFVENEDMEILLKDTCTIVKNWIDMNKNFTLDERSEVSWQTLCALNVDQKALLALLGYIIKTGQSLDADEDSRQACLHATSLYLTLLAIPGSSAYQIFHENLYEIVLKTLELSKHLMPVVKKPTKNQDYESLYDRDDESNTLLQTEKITLTQGLNTIMYNMILMLESWSMRDYVRSLELTVHSLIEVTKLVADSNDSRTSLRHSERSVSSLVHNSYAALGQLCNPRHGLVDVTIKLIARYILPHLLHNYTSITPKLLNAIRDMSINFLKTLLNMHQKNAAEGIMILIQHLMINCPERLEARQKQALIIVKLMNICDRSLYMKIIANLVLFSHNNKIACRIFSQEIIAKLLESSSIEGPSEMDDSMGVSSQINVKKILLATVLTRCTDVSSMARGRAMQTLAEYTDNSENPFVVDLFKESNEGETCPLPCLENIQSALVDNVNLIPDCNTLLAVLKIRAEDERAVIRTRAIQMLRNGVLIVPELLDSVIPIVSNHCRDPVMIVRRYSIQVLSTLLETFPDDSNLYKVWVRAVVPQIFDVESKVQEKVLESMEDLIINRISNANDVNTDHLPWRILNELTLRKMRKHLTRACDIWVSNGTITERLIKNIQSYIDTQHNIPAWILLEALAEHKILPNMKKYFEDYNSLLKGKGFFEYLALEVLRCCWTTFDNPLLAQLSADLLKLFHDSSINPELISISLDILYGILKQLNPSEPEKIAECMQVLIKQSEKVIERIILDIDHTAEDISNYLKAICTLGHASFLCTTNISISVLRILQGMLIDWETMPSSLRHVRELQATTIVALGQQAMREQSIAYEMTPIFGQLLSDGVGASNDKADAAVRVNAAKALADVCTRFTALVEPHLPDMCISMKGENATVREAIVVIFIQLLVEDFIKVKGYFFFHILTMLSDPDDTIREMTVFLIRERLLVKNKTLISQQFLESLFHYNDYEMDKKYYERKMGATEREALTLPGKVNETKRRMIYDFMIEHLDPPGKLKLLVGLTSQVLNGVISERIKINVEKGDCVLKDSLYIIGSSYLQPSSCGHKQNDDDLEEPTAQPPVSNAANVIAEGIKKHYRAVLMPVLMKLKKKLEKKNKSLMDDVSRLFVKIGSEFNREQLSSLYNEHPDIETELEHDIRKYSKRGHFNDHDNDDGDSGGDGEDIGRDVNVNEEGKKTNMKNTNSSTISQQPSSSTHTQVHPLLDSNRIPRIVLHRLSPSMLRNNNGHSSRLIDYRSADARKLTQSINNNNTNVNNNNNNNNVNNNNNNNNVNNNININNVNSNSDHSTNRTNRIRTSSNCSVSSIIDEPGSSSTPKSRKYPGKYLRF